MNAFLNFINGKKTYIGVIGATVCAVLTAVGVPVPVVVPILFKGLAGIGAVHKAAKLGAK